MRPEISGIRQKDAQFCQVHFFWSEHSNSTYSQFSKKRQKKIIRPFLSLFSLILTIFFTGNLKASLAGPQHFRGMNMTADEFEFLIGNTGAIQTEVKSDPRPKVKDVMMSSLRNNQDSDNDDW